MFIYDSIGIPVCIFTGQVPIWTFKQNSSGGCRCDFLILMAIDTDKALDDRVTTKLKLTG